MCSKLTAGQSSGIGFGLDLFQGLFGYGQQRAEVARKNQAIARQNQLLINNYNTKKVNFHEKNYFYIFHHTHIRSTNICIICRIKKRIIN